MELYLAMKRNEILTTARKWMELEFLMLNELVDNHKETAICPPIRVPTFMYMKLLRKYLKLESGQQGRRKRG